MKRVLSNPYLLLFPLGILALWAGILVWVPLLWNQDIYPLAWHRYLVLNGFVACFIAGFLMTAIPRFTKSPYAYGSEVALFSAFTLLGLYEPLASVGSLGQALSLILFITLRIQQRQENPPYSFLFLFIGLALWVFAEGHALYTGSLHLKVIHYEGAFAAFIFGVGSRLIPGILGHSQIVQSQRAHYERPLPLYRTIPPSFIPLLLIYPLSYLASSPYAEGLRFLVVGLLSLTFWRLHKLPQNRSALTWSIWISAWCICISFLLRVIFYNDGNHISHTFFLSGLVLLTLMVATRVIQSHGPKDPTLENSPVLWWSTGLILLAMLTRVTAFYMPDHYLNHLAYASTVLLVATLLWSWKYLRYLL